MHDLLKSCVWSGHDLPLSLSLNEENMVINTREVLQQRESKDQKVLTGRKLAIEQAVMTTSQHVGVASSIWTNKTRSFAAAWWLSNNSLANTVQKARCREWCWLVLEKLHARVEECGSGMVGSSSKVHGDMTARQNVDIGWFCRKPRITFNDILEGSMPPSISTMFVQGNNNSVRVWLRLGNWNT